MKKLQSARDHLLTSALRIKADKLMTFAEKGTVTSYARADHQNRDFQVAYTAHLIVTDYSGEPLDLFFVMVEWLHRACPGAAPDALKFHVDIVDTKQADVSLMIELTETVTATAAPTGIWLMPDIDPNSIAAALFPGQP